MAVPAVTYANDAIVIGKTNSKLLDRYKTEIGTWLLVANFCTANAEITGEMWWLIHEDMEAKSKTYYLGRLASLSSERYARRIYHHIIYRGIRTGWIRKIAAIDSKLSADTPRHHTTSEKQCASTTRSEIAAKRTHLWQEAMSKKQSLARYRLSTTQGRTGSRPPVPGRQSKCPPLPGSDWRLADTEEETGALRRRCDMQTVWPRG